MVVIEEKLKQAEEENKQSLFVALLKFMVIILFIPIVPILYIFIWTANTASKLGQKIKSSPSETQGQDCFIAKRWKKNMSETQGQEQFRGKTVVIKQETKT